MTIIKCTVCGEEFELTEALSKDIEKTLLATERAKHSAELEKAKKEVEDSKKESKELKEELTCM